MLLRDPPLPLRQNMLIVSCAGVSGSPAVPIAGKTKQPCPKLLGAKDQQRRMLTGMTVALFHDPIWPGSLDPDTLNIS